MRIGIALYSFSGFAESALRGIAAYARPNRPWTFDHGNQTLSGVNRLLSRNPDGILISVSDPEVCERLQATHVPIVNMHYADALPRAGRVSNDDAAIGVLAAKHFLSRGHKRFAYYAETGEPIDGRLRGFREELARSRHSCEVFHGGPHNDLAEYEARYEQPLQRWLQGLPKPIGVFCAHDHFAWRVAESCQGADISVPAEVSIVGVDNDTAICALADPPLSSVQTGSLRIGYEAAKLLDQMMTGEPLSGANILVPPVRVITRRSSDAMAAADTLVATALTHMRTHLHDTKGIDQLSVELHCSRRTLERRFHESVGTTPAQAWSQFRLEEAQRLLAETDLKLRLVAELSGFGEGKNLSEAFKRLTGQTPGQFRRQAQPEIAEDSPGGDLRE